MSPIRCMAGACWMAGGWVETERDLARDQGVGFPPVEDHNRIARADDLTRLGAGVVLRAIAGLAAVPAQRLALVGGSVLASLRTNEQYEQRRTRTGRAAPRDFPYTAPNAWLGEIAAAIGARGPCLCLVGGSDVGLAAVAAACRMLHEGNCDRVVVVVGESLPREAALLPPSFRGWVDGAASLVLERSSDPCCAEIRAGWHWPDGADGDRPSSVDALARVLLHARARVRARIVAPSLVGAACWVEVV